MGTAKTTVNFGILSSRQSGTLSLDTEYNRDFYELGDTESKTVFLPEEIAYLKILPCAAALPYSLGSSLGVLTVANLNVLYDYTEDVTFVHSREGLLSFIPTGTVIYEWIGNDGGSPTFVNKGILLPTKIIGILRCTYTVLGDRLKLSDAELEDAPYSVLCVANYGTDNTTATVNFDRGDVPSEVSLEISVIDMCTGDPIPDATVQVAGLPSGITDETGVYSPNSKVTTGESYGLVVSASGYTTSDVDFIKNDSFTVPFVKEETEEEGE